MQLSNVFKTTGRVINISLRVITRAILILILLALVVGALYFLYWVMSPVKTSAGSISRAQVMRTYFHLYSELSPECKSFYGVMAPNAFAQVIPMPIAAAAQGAIQWSEVPSQIWKLAGQVTDLLFFDRDGSCTFPRPEQLRASDLA